VRQLATSIAAAEAMVPKVISALDEAKALKTQLEQELEQHKVDRADAEAAIKEATSLREKEAAAFAKESGDMQTNIAARGKASGTISRGTGCVFLRTTASAVPGLPTILETSSDGSFDRHVITAFLAEGLPVVPVPMGMTKPLENYEVLVAEAVALRGARLQAKAASLAEHIRALDVRERTVGGVRGDILRRAANTSEPWTCTSGPWSGS